MSTETPTPEQTFGQFRVIPNTTRIIGPLATNYLAARKVVGRLKVDSQQASIGNIAIVANSENGPVALCAWGNKDGSK